MPLIREVDTTIHQSFRLSKKRNEVDDITSSWHQLHPMLLSWCNKCLENLGDNEMWSFCVVHHAPSSADKLSSAVIFGQCSVNLWRGKLPLIVVPCFITFVYKLCILLRSFKVLRRPPTLEFPLRERSPWGHGVLHTYKGTSCMHNYWYRKGASKVKGPTLSPAYPRIGYITLSCQSQLTGLNCLWSAKHEMRVHRGD